MDGADAAFDGSDVGKSGEIVGAGHAGGSRFHEGKVEGRADVRAVEAM